MNDNTDIIPIEKIESIKTFVEEQMTVVRSLSVVDATSMAEATDRGQKIKQAIKKLEDMRTDIVKPLNDRVKDINSQFKYFTEPLTVAKDELNRKMVTFHAAEIEKERKTREAAEMKQQIEIMRLEKEQREAEERLQQEAAKIVPDLSMEELIESQKKVEQELEAIEKLAELKKKEEMRSAMLEPVNKTTRTVNGSKITFREVWNFEVIDKTITPEDYKIVDEAQVRVAIYAGVREIPGIKIFKVILSAQ